MRVSFIPALWLLSITATSAAGPPQVKLDMSKFETALADYFVDQKADSHATLEAKLVEKTITFCKNVDAKEPCLDWKFTPQEFGQMQMPPPVPGQNMFCRFYKDALSGTDTFGSLDSAFPGIFTNAVGTFARRYKQCWWK